MANDSSGFTPQTSIILEGLGAGVLIPEIKKRNISTSCLFELSKQDFITLGADENLADNIIKRLKIRVEASKSKLKQNQQESNDYIDILRNGKQQLSFIQAHLMYTKHKLFERQNDFIVDYEHNVKASEALHLAASSALQELETLQSELIQLSALLIGVEKKKYFKLNNLITGIGVSVSLLLAWKYFSLLK